MSCNHIWMTETDKPVSTRRECAKCGKRQETKYLGGSMWNWVDG